LAACKPASACVFIAVFSAASVSSILVSKIIQDTLRAGYGAVSHTEEAAVAKQYLSAVKARNCLGSVKDQIFNQAPG
jgi:hypothetical protein